MNPHLPRHCETIFSSLRGESIRFAEAIQTKYKTNIDCFVRQVALAMTSARGLFRPFHSLAMTTLSPLRHCEKMNEVNFRGNLLSLNGLLRLCLAMTGVGNGLLRLCLAMTGGGSGLLRQLRFLAMTALPLSLSNLHATELSSICTRGQGCIINSNYESITNSGRYITGTDIRISSRVDTFTNYGDIIVGSGNQAIAFETSGYIGHFINYGNVGMFDQTIGNGARMSFWIANNSAGVGKITNYGFMSYIHSEVSSPTTLNSLGLMWVGSALGANIQTQNNGRILIQNYTLMINETATQFLAFSGHQNYLTDFSHLTLSATGNRAITFKDKNSRIAFDFGRNFELGVAYSIDKVATGTNGTSYTALGVDFNRLTTRNDIYYLTKQGNSFIVKANPNYSTIGMLYKSNIKTMNNFFFQSNNMIYPHKYKKKKRLGANGVNPSVNPSAPNNYRRVGGISNLFRNPHNIYLDSSPLREVDSSIESMAWQSMNDSYKWIASGNALAMTDDGLIASASPHNDKKRANLNDNEVDSSLSHSSLRDLPLGKAKQSINKSNQWIASYSTNTRNDDSLTSPSLRENERSEFSWQSTNSNEINESNESTSDFNESKWIASYSANTRNDRVVEGIASGNALAMTTLSLIRHSELSLESEESTNLNNSLDSNLDSFALDSSLRALHYAQNDEVEANSNDNEVDSSLSHSSLRDLPLGKAKQSINKSNQWIASYSTNTRNDGEVVSSSSHSSLRESALADSWQSTNNYYANLPIQSNELFFYDNEWLLARDNANARKVNMDYTHSVKAVNNSNVSKDAYYNKGAYRNKIITNDTRTNELNQYQSTNRQGNVSRTPNQNNRHLANQSNNSPCGSYKCIYIYRPQQPQPKPEPKVEPKPQPKVEPKVEQPKPQPKPVQVIRPTMPPPPKVEPKPEPKPEPKVVKVEPKPTPPKPKVIIEDPYYFVLTPYAGHNFFYEAGKYHISGPEYGFITAFSGKLDDDNILGTHFAFSYSNLTDEVEVFDLKSMNIMLGLNYKLDNLVNDTYLKARIDAFYFLNTISSRMVLNLKPNNLAFGASVAYGKEWYLGTDEILGLEGGISYKALYGNNFNIEALDKSYVDTFKNALYNMLYVDLGVNYDKYFETSVGRWGLDTGLGVRGNITANMLARSRVDAMDGDRKLTMTLDNDRFIAYLNVGGSYLLEKKDFDMEFSLAYYGNFGDRTMSNVGGFEWRVYW